MVLAKLRVRIATLLLVCGTTTCTRSKTHTNTNATQSATATVPTQELLTLPSIATISTETNAFATQPTPAVEVRRAILEHDYTRALRLLDAAPPLVNTSTLELVRGFLAVETAQPKPALEHLSRVGNDFAGLAQWQLGLQADALGQLPAYIEHLPEITTRAPLERLLAVTKRLIDDRAFAKAERTLVVLRSKASSEAQHGEARWLGIRLNVAMGRIAMTREDVRWLVVTHPSHVRAPLAMAAIERGELPALSVNEHLLRAQTAAELGLSDVVDASAKTVIASNPTLLPPGEQAYLRGLALYRARRFEAAIAPLDEAVRLLAARRDRASYLAALAASRAGLGQMAVERWTALSARKLTTPNGENAALLLAREHSLMGDWSKAAEQYSQFLLQFPNHELTQVAHREQLIAWFAQGNFKRFIYWVREFRRRYPEAKEGLLLRSLEALALHRLGHTDLARAMWEELAHLAPLSLVGIVARQRLAAVDVKVPVPITLAVNAEPEVSLPAPVEQLELAGLSEQSEVLFRKLEPSFARAFAPHETRALCEATADLERGRRRFELGRQAAAERGLKDAPQLAPPWLWDCLYPTPHSVSVRTHGATFGVNTSLIYAVMRQESAFDVGAQSTAGAHGLMQIIDATAQRIATDLGIDFAPAHLDIADRNIEYGTFYLGKLQAHFRHPALVAAAYNAGPDAAARWFAAGRDLPLEAFIARIPYDETRAYVQRVLENSIVYSMLLSGETTPTLPLEFDLATQGGAPASIPPQVPDGFY